MEDKKTLLAFLLIGLILLAIPYYYEIVGLGPEPIAEEEDIPAPTEVKRPAAPLRIEEPAAPATTTSTPPTPPSDSVRPAPAGQRLSSTTTAAPVFVAREVKVNTPLQQLVFSTAGGVLTSAELLEYKKLSGEVVNLVPYGGKGLALSLVGGGKETDLSGVEFVPDRDVIEIGPQEEATLRMRAELGNGKVIEKVFRFSADRYGSEMELNYLGFSSEPLLFLGWENGIANTEEKPGGDLPGGFVGAQEILSLAYLNGERLTSNDRDDDEPMLAEKGKLRWAGVANQYFFLALAPLDPGHYSLELYPQEGGQLFNWEGYSFRVGTRLSGSGSFRTLVYPGPLDYEELKSYEVELEQGIDLGFPIIKDISKVLLLVFLAIKDITQLNYGWVLILFAIAIKILVYPLTKKSYKSMAKMQQVQPKIAALREKYKNDNQRLSQATMKLYKEEGVNPIGGCLPMLLQMPIFFALYSLFYNIELRQEPFTLWITDLSRPDEIMIGDFGLHVLPLLMAGSMLIQQKMTMKDPKQAFLVYLMPAFLLYIFWSLPSGLVLYWTVFNILQIAQQVYTNRSEVSAVTPNSP